MQFSPPVGKYSKAVLVFIRNGKRTEGGKSEAALFWLGFLVLPYFQ
jgi:hypothetical protein